MIKMEEKTVVVEKYRIILIESYDDESIKVKDIDTQEEAQRIAGKLQREKSGRMSYVPLEIKCRIEPYQTKIPIQGLPKKGDLMYVPAGLEKLLVKPSFESCQIGIKGGLAEVSSVSDLGNLEPKWFVHFNKLDATYSLQYLMSVQDELKVKYKHHSAEPIYDLFMKGFFREMEDYD